MTCSFIQKKKLLFTLRDSELSIQPNKRTGLYNSATLTVSPCATPGCTLLCVSCYMCFPFASAFSPGFGSRRWLSTNWLFSGLWRTCFCAFSCCHCWHGWTVSQGWQHCQTHVSNGMDLLFLFQMCFTSPQPVLPIFPEFCFCKLNWPNYAQGHRLAN